MFTRRTLLKLAALLGFSVPAVALAKPQETFPVDECLLCGYKKMLKSWGGPVHVLRCADIAGCQARQMNAKLRQGTYWQARNKCCLKCGEYILEPWYPGKEKDDPARKG